jgi:hypothetical protein
MSRSAAATDPAATQWLALCGDTAASLRRPAPCRSASNAASRPGGRTQSLSSRRGRNRPGSAETREALVEQVAWALATGNHVVIGTPSLIPDLLGALPEPLLARIETPRDWRLAGPYARALVAGAEPFLREGTDRPCLAARSDRHCRNTLYRRRLCARSPARETSISINTTAAGGNAVSWQWFDTITEGNLHLSLDRFRFSFKIVLQEPICMISPANRSHRAGGFGGDMSMNGKCRLPRVAGLAVAAVLAGGAIAAPARAETDGDSPASLLS